MAKIFISSTVYDLIDARAEAERFLSKMRLEPVVSGIATSKLQPLPDRNSIETCLANLRQCDAVVIILNQRYGSSLQSAGYEDISATHLEYNEARSHQKPIHMYVRDRLAGDFSLYQKNAHMPQIQYRWVPEAEDQKLFQLIDDHQRLVKGSSLSNWYDTFRDTIELKTLLKRDFGPIALREDLQRLIELNHIPNISLDVETEHSDSLQRTMINILITNVGTVPAYKFTYQLEGVEKKDEVELPMLAPQQTVHQTIYRQDGDLKWELSRTLNIKYYMPQGHRVFDEFQIGLRVTTGICESRAICVRKEFCIAKNDTQPYIIVEE